MVSLSSSVFVLLLGALPRTAHVYASYRGAYQCEPCWRNSAVTDEDGCEELIAATSLLQSGTTDCLNAQLLNYQNSCCEEAPRSCTLCPDGSPFNPNAVVPSFNPDAGAITCADLNIEPSFLDYLFHEGDCSDTLLQRSASWCGCPSVQRSCYLCPDGSRPPNPNLVDPVYYGWTCASFDFVSSYFSPYECQTMVEHIFEFDAPSWCGCPDSPIPSVCRLCPEGQQIVKPHEVLGDGEFTCQELALSTRYIPSQEPCDRVLNTYRGKGYVDYCCGPISSANRQSVTVILSLAMVVGLGLLS
mmetsp:Transcript_8610/g.15718  ORF Transcript_8610/g.15718 Transcript_8610/m.15718 type:complete len:301 (-) Transcript_8610:153-1055(-)|eukprot:CAMPEP_0178737960 /NCGR_PEP_ID=MMETSP0744-20121128/3256_1 /TAXON_ID=913974 /ORGANISM="Nitzschia punctata, Strain CCMP561" /LENGTH=300 /DNA_ID=CAMNT_0020390543 /DNA_START=27 /DNA_END=929 /DNA_ORIENTATION=-